MILHEGTDVGQGTQREDGHGLLAQGGGHCARRICRPAEVVVRGGARMHHQVFRPESLHDLAGNGEAVGERRVAVDGADAADVQLRGMKGLDQGEGVVDVALVQAGRDVDVEPDVRGGFCSGDGRTAG